MPRGHPLSAELRTLIFNLFIHQRRGVNDIYDIISSFPGMVITLAYLKRICNMFTSTYEDESAIYYSVSS
jgi:hypothetical protein